MVLPPQVVRVYRVTFADDSVVLFGDFSMPKDAIEKLEESRGPVQSIRILFQDRKGSE